MLMLPVTDKETYILCLVKIKSITAQILLILSLFGGVVMVEWLIGVVYTKSYSCQTQLFPG